MKKLAFLFSGQGSQTPGMMKDLYDSSTASKAVFDVADRVLGRSISELCFIGTQEELNLTHNTQPCLLAADLAAFAAAKERGLDPSVVAGFSLGEYAALVSSGVLSMEDAFWIIQIRADVMQQTVPIGQGAMAAVMKIKPDEVSNLCSEVDGYVIPTNFNSPLQTVVSGENAAVDQLLVLAKARKIRAVKLPVSAPFHCKLMEPARKELEKMFAQVEFHNASIPVYMNIDGRPHINAGDIKQSVLTQTISPVQWVDTLVNMNVAGINSFIELGVGKTLSGFVANTISDAMVAQITDSLSLSETVGIFGGR